MSMFFLSFLARMGMRVDMEGQARQAGREWNLGLGLGAGTGWFGEQKCIE